LYLSAPIANPRGEARARALREEARRMFLEQGYERTNINELVRRAGGSMATLYRYYGGKAGLFAAMMDEAREQLLTPLTRLGDRNEAPAVFLARLGEAFLRLVVSPEGVRFFRVLLAETHKFPELQKAVERALAQLTNHLSAYLDAQVAAGCLQLTDTRRAAAHFYELVKGQAQLLAVTGLSVLCEDDVRRQTASAVDLFLYGCACPRRVT
jgi:AcrR family transcriptional regulator